MLDRLFLLISFEEIEEYCSSFPGEVFKYIPGTLQMHQVVTTSGDMTHIHYRNISFVCMNCLGGRIHILWKKKSVQGCIWNNNIEEIAVKRKIADCQLIVTKINVMTNMMTKMMMNIMINMMMNIDLNDDEINEWETTEFMEGEASKSIEEGDIA